MNLLCIGISHHTAPVEIRERLWFSDEEISACLEALRRDGYEEAVLFSTCNRTELYTLGTLEHVEHLQRRLIEAKSAQNHVQREHFFTHLKADATEHLFRVAAGVDSMIVGDVQVLSQIKDGYRAAQKHETLGFSLNKLFQAAFHVGKRARTETSISEGAISVSYGAVELAGRIFDNLHEKTALVIGAGEMAELTAKHLRGKKIGKLLITNRTQEKAEALAKKVDGAVVPFSSFREHLREVDILISSVEADRYILSADDIQRINKNRRSALFIIDIGVPRNIDPAARRLDNVFLYDIDSLQSMVNENIERRAKAIPVVNSIIREELDVYLHWLSTLQAKPTITSLIDMAEQIRKTEVEKNLNRLHSSDHELIEMITKRIVNKILHTPITNLKNGRDEHAGELAQKISAVRKLFGLDGTSTSGSSESSASSAEPLTEDSAESKRKGRMNGS